jgi:hypothetical protein
MLTRKNVGNTPKMTKKCSQHFQKMLIEKILTTVQKIISKKIKKKVKNWGLESSKWTVLGIYEFL